MREKLILWLLHIGCPDDGCDFCQYGESEHWRAEVTADFLIANGVTIQQWIPVTERLPEIVKTERAWKNVYRKSGRVLCACKQADGKRFVKEGYMEFFNDYPEPSWKIPGTIHSVTHWMPLPEPTKEV